MDELILRQLHALIVDRQDTSEDNSSPIPVNGHVEIVEFKGLDQTLAVSQHRKHMNTDLRQVLITENQGAKRGEVNGHLSIL